MPHGMGLDIRSRYLLFVLLSAKFALILGKMQNHSKIHQLQFSAATTIHAFIKKNGTRHTITSFTNTVADGFASDIAIRGKSAYWEISKVVSFSILPPAD